MTERRLRSRPRFRPPRPPAEAAGRALLESALDCIVSVDADGRIVEWNSAAERTFGHRRDDVLSRRVGEVLVPERLRAAHERGLARRLAGDEPFERRMEVSALRADGSELPIELTITRVDWDGPPMLTATLRDLSERRSTEQQLRLRDRAMAAAVNGIVITDARSEGNPIIYVNPAVERMTGYRAEELLGRNPRLLQGADTEQRVRAALAEAIAAGRECTVTIRNYRRDRTPFWNELSVSPVRDASGRISNWVGIQHDVSERVRAQKRIAYLAYHDELTGLPNRAMFSEHLDLALARAERHGRAVGVLSIDLDNFKLVNDSFGHRGGDELLRQAARRLREVTRATDLVSRVGGDEFLVLLADLEQSDQGGGNFADARQIAEAIAGKIRYALQGPFVVAGADISSGGSVGVALYPADAADRDQLLRFADTVMYVRKQSRGVERATDAEATSVEARRQLSLTSRLRRGIDRGDFLLHYQPQVDLETGDLVGVEALLRWFDEGRGLVSAAEFVPLAERTGMIRALSDWVIDEVCRQWGRWARRGMVIDAAFNLPPMLWRPALVNHVLDAVRSFDVDPSRLTIEITESALQSDSAGARRAFEGLRRAGLRLAIDDFGTGYSSLSRLTEMPVSTLKVDRSFVRNVPDEPGAAAVVKTIIQLACNLGMQPLAEGIEREDQRRFLLDHGCRLGQGFHFSRPVEPAAIEALYRR